MFKELLLQELAKLAAEASKSSPHYVGKGNTTGGQKILQSFKDKGFFIPPNATVTTDTTTTSKGQTVVNTAKTDKNRAWIQTQAPADTTTKAVNPTQLPMNLKPVKKLSEANCSTEDKDHKKDPKKKKMVDDKTKKASYMVNLLAQGLKTELN